MLSYALLQVPPGTGRVALLPPEAGSREVGIICFKSSLIVFFQSKEVPVRSQLASLSRSPRIKFLQQEVQPFVIVLASNPFRYWIIIDIKTT